MGTSPAAGISNIGMVGSLWHCWHWPDTSDVMQGALRTAVTTALLLFVAAAPATTHAQAPSTRSATPTSFETIALDAARAREAGRLDEAIAAYRHAVQLRPKWDEGWWYLATSLYEQGQHKAAREAFTRFLTLKPDTAAAFALRGLCEFGLQRYDEALADLHTAHALGITGNPELRRETWYHSAVLLIRRGQFELAVEPLTLLARSESESALLVQATGLMVLRLPYLPTEVPADTRELVTAAGQAGFSWLSRNGAEAEKRFRSLVNRYGDVPYVHYAYGVFLLKSDSDAALSEFKREIEINPYSPYPHLEIAFELLRRGDPAAARQSAEEAVAIAPDLFSARNALGRILVDIGELHAGISQLETAVKLAPEVPEMHFSLANAYARAGRTADAAREREIFQKLNSVREIR